MVKPVNVADLPYYDPVVDRKVALVTGGNSGIGYYTVLHLYLHGFKVYLGGRNSHRVNHAIKEIRQEAKVRLQKDKDNTLSRKVGQLEYLHIDLTDLNSVEKACKKLRTQETTLDVLINNAGVMALPYGLTKDNFEIQMQTNYISHFLLTIRLLPLLKAAHGRIVTVSSVGHQLILFNCNPGSQFNYWPDAFFMWCRYALAKTASIQFTKMLAIKHPDILSVSLHPGLVMNTNLFSYCTRLPFVGIFFWILFQVVGYFFGVSNEQGSISTLKCALSPDLSTELDNGAYFTTGGYMSTPSRVARSLDNAASTWIWTVNELRNRGHEV